MNKQDDISKSYKPSGLLNTLSVVSFWANAAAALLILCVPALHNNMLMYIQVFLAVACIIISVVDDGFFWFEAEAARRHNCIEDAFNIELSEAKTSGYYNNAATPSALRYALNNYESAYCSKAVAQRMIPTAIGKTLVAIMVFVVSWRAVSDVEIVLALAQIVFSSVFVSDTIMLFIYIFRIRQICDTFYTLFITEKGTSNTEKQVLLLSNSIDYEVVKGFYKVRLSERIFKKMQPELEVKWAALSAKIEI